MVAPCPAADDASAIAELAAGKIEHDLLAAAADGVDTDFAIDALDLRPGYITGPAEHLGGFARDMFEHPRRLDLQHGEVGRQAPAGFDLPGTEIDPRLGRCDLPSAVGELNAD